MLVLLFDLYINIMGLRVVGAFYLSSCNNYIHNQPVVCRGLNESRIG